MSPRNILLLFAAVIMLAVSVPAQARTFTVGVENIDYYPLYSGEKNEYRGYSRAILDAFAESKGYTFKYKPLPLKRLYRDFFSGEVDFKYPDTPLWNADQRKGKNIAYSEPVVEYIDGVMVTPAHKDAGPGSIKTLGLISGFTAWEFLDDIKAGKIKVEENSNYTSLLKKTMLGRVDGAYSNVAVANYQLREVLKKPHGLVLAANLPHTKSHYSISSINHQSVIEEFNSFLEQNQALVKRLKKEYMVRDF